MKKLLFSVVAVCAAALSPASASAQQPATVTGRVTNEAGAPLPGVQVFIQDLNIGGVTRDDGQYTFIVPAARATGQTVALATRQVGYRAATAQITLNAGQTITQDFQLVAAPITLSTVVVTGAGTVTTQEKLGNVRTAVDSSLIRRSNEPNVVNALAGKAANVQVTSQSGDPGASSSIRIRGLKTISGTGQPLFVIDGSPVTNETISTDPTEAGTAGIAVSNRLADLNPNDVESVEILKGAAAAAIYGARAGQGVVLITTKRGQPGPTRYQLRSTYTNDQVNRDIPLQRIFGQGTQGAPAICRARGCNLAATAFGPRLAPGTPTYDHFDEAFGTGYTSDNTLTVSGGNERTTFLLSGGYLFQDGIAIGPNSSFNRATVRLKGTHRLFRDFNLQGNFSYADSRLRGVPKGSNTSGLGLGSWRTPPDFDNRQYIDTVTGNHRSYRYPQPLAGRPGQVAGRGYDNPFFVLYETENTQEVGRAFGNVGFDWTALPWLSVRYTLGADYSNDERLGALPFTSSSRPTGQVIAGNYLALEYDHNLIATAQRDFSENLAGSLTIGQNLNSRRFNQEVTRGFDLIAPTPFNLNNVTDFDPAPFTSLRRIESYFAQGTVDLYEQLYLTGSIRNDAFSTFGSNNRRNWFPRASASWVFTNPFPNLAGLSSGKVRAALGQTGIEPPVYAIFSNFTAANYGDGGWGSELRPSAAGLGGLRESGTLAQPNLKPERQTEFETGIDLGFLDERLLTTFTYYDSKSTDVIFEQPVSAATGFTEQAANAGTIRNRGVEFTVDYTALQRANLRWDVGLQYAKNVNKVLDLRGNQFIDLPSGGGFTGAVPTAWEGSRVGVLRGNDFARCGRGAVIEGVGNIDELCGAEGVSRRALFIGADGFPVFDPTQRVIADGNPDWTGGLRSSLRFGKVTLSGLLDTRQGGQVWNGTKGALYNFGTHKDTEIRGQARTFGTDYALANRGPRSYAVAGPGAGTPVVLDQNTWFQFGLGSGFVGPSSLFVEDGSFVRLRELAIQYTLDGGFVNRGLGLGSVDLRLAGRNLGLWTDYSGIDPETNLAGAESAFQGVDYFNNPQTRSIVFTIGLTR